MDVIDRTDGCEHGPGQTCGQMMEDKRITLAAAYTRESTARRAGSHRLEVGTAVN